MAKITQVRLVDDIDESEAVETIEFSLRDKAFTIDLSADHVKALEESIAEFAEHAQPITKGPVQAQLRPARARRGGTVRSTVDREQTQAVREWARQNGFKVSDRGRIPQAVLRAFHEAHGSAA